MKTEIIIDECFNCKKKKDIGDNWRTCKLKCSYKYKRKENDYITRLEQENRELSFAIEKCLENAGIECDDEEQALRSLPILGNAHYKVLVEKEELEQENLHLKEQLEPFSDEYFKDLTNGTIAQLAKTSLRNTADNCRLTHALEEIRETIKQDCGECEFNNICCEADDCEAGKLQIIQTKINEVLE